MAAPIYSQAEAQMMLAVEKWLASASFGSMLSTRISRARHSKKVSLIPQGDMVDRILLALEIQSNERTEETSITLIGSLDDRGNQGLCRYEIQRMSHYNKHPCDGLLVPANVVHRHVYSEVAARQLHHWDSCAEPLEEIPTGGSFAQVRERILRRMIDDLNIHFVDPEAEDHLF